MIYLHYYAGYSTKEIANALSLGESAVRVRLLRARENEGDIKLIVNGVEVPRHKEQSASVSAMDSDENPTYWGFYFRLTASWALIY